MHSKYFEIKVLEFFDLNIKFRTLFIRYEPELHPGVTYRIKSPKATLKIYSTGSITVTGKIQF